MKFFIIWRAKRRANKYVKAGLVTKAEVNDYVKAMKMHGVTSTEAHEAALKMLRHIYPTLL
jgi:hypothetical protein